MTRPEFIFAVRTPMDHAKQPRSPNSQPFQSTLKLRGLKRVTIVRGTGRCTNGGAGSARAHNKCSGRLRGSMADTRAVFDCLKRPSLI